MRLIEAEAAIECLRTNHPAVVGVRDYVEPTKSSGDFYLRWKEHMNFTWLAKALVPTLQSGMGTTVCFDEYGIWPSNENPFLFQVFSLQLFGTPLKVPTSAFYFEPGEVEALSTLLQIGLQCGWGGIMFENDSNWFAFDHDQFGILRSASKEAQDLSKQLDEL